MNTIGGAYQDALAILNLCAEKGMSIKDIQEALKDANYLIDAAANYCLAKNGLYHPIDLKVSWNQKGCVIDALATQKLSKNNSKE